MEGPGEGLWPGTVPGTETLPALLPTRSVCLKRCFRLRRLCFRISREEVLCSVELLNLGDKKPEVREVRGMDWGVRAAPQSIAG